MLNCSANVAIEIIYTYLQGFFRCNQMHALFIRNQYGQVLPPPSARTVSLKSVWLSQWA